MNTIKEVKEGKDIRNASNLEQFNFAFPLEIRVFFYIRVYFCSNKVNRKLRYLGFVNITGF